MYERILVPTDGSSVAAAAGEAAVALADQFGAGLHAIYVVDRRNLPRGFESEAAEERVEQGEVALSTLSEQASAAGLDVTTSLLGAENSEPVHRAIIDYTDGHDIDCVVMGTHGRSGVGRFVLGSVAEQTLRESPVPVLTLHEETSFDPALDSILVPTDGSESAEAALDHAIEYALETDGTIHIVNVVDTRVLAEGFDAGSALDALEEAGERALEVAIHRAEDAGVSSVQASVLSGTPHRAICDYVEDRDVDGIVMGTHGRTGIERYILGSVTERVVRHSDVPVIATKAPDADD